MSVKISTSGLLLDALEDNPNIKAVLLVDGRGYIIEQRGDARSIKKPDGPEVEEKRVGQLENVYLVAAGDDYLLVIFDDRLNFERLKSSVDSTLSQFELAPV